MRGYICLAALCGIWIWYWIFYFQYQYKDIISELRKNLKSANDQIISMQDEMEELTAENELFREKTTELLEKNDELSDVVAELWKYYVHMKKASEKTAELSKFLHDPDEEMWEKLGSLWDEKWGQKNAFF